MVLEGEDEEEEEEEDKECVKRKRTKSVNYACKHAENHPLSTMYIIIQSSLFSFQKLEGRGP